MAQKKQDLSISKLGIDRNTHPSQLQQTQYTHAFNANVENESGNTLNVISEKSNLLAENFPNFVVHGVQNDPNSNSTFFFLLNPTTGEGRFGYIENNQNINDLEDATINCPECNEIRELATPLEDINQTPLQDFIQILSDACKTDKKEGFNFNINYPIKSIVVKQEKVGTKIYFTDNYNPPRVIDLDKATNPNNSEYYFAEQVPCDDDIPISCMNFDELRIFRLFNRPELIPATIELGGRLKMGVYEFLIAYCEPSGEEISPYFSLTNPISIFDFNNMVLEQKNIADATSLAIKLNIENLDTRYSHYKIAVVQTADIEGATRYYEEGIHTTNDTTIIYSGEQGKKATSLDKLLTPQLYVEKTETLTESNNILFQAGVTLKNEINLQPVVNLMGELLQWQTHIAGEDFYSDGIAVSKYLGYQRDEIVPFSVRFLMTGGYETALFPFIGRTPKLTDLEYLVEVDEDGIPVLDEDGKMIPIIGSPEEMDVDSIIGNVIDCVSSIRTKRWQFYNTAELTGACDLEGIQTIKVSEDITRTCLTESIEGTPESPEDHTLYSIPAGTIEIDIAEEFSSLEDYINAKKEDCPTADLSSPASSVDICSYLVPTTPYTQCTDIFSDLESEFDCDGNPIPPALLDKDCNIITPTLKSTTIEVDKVVGEEVNKVPAAYPSSYAIMSAPKACSFYETDETGLPIELEDNEAVLGYGANNVVYVRNSEFINENCSYAENINISPVTGNNINNAFNNNYKNSFIPPTSPLSDLVYQEKNSVAYPADDFNLKLHKNALWFKLDLTNQEEQIVDISKYKKIGVLDSVDPSTNDPKLDDLLYTSKVRISIYKSCSSPSPIYTKIVDLHNGAFIKLKQDDTTETDLEIIDNSGATTIAPGGWTTNKKYVIAIDTSITARTIDTDPTGVVFNETMWINNPTQGCYTVTKRNISYSKIIVEWDSIELIKKEEWEALGVAFEQPVVQNCKANPFQKGDFAYWESQEVYADNNELYNSSNLKIKPEDLATLNPEDKLKFENAFVKTIAPDVPYTWKTSNKVEGDDLTEAFVTDFTCRNIRHFRFPDNKVAPFTYDTQQPNFSKSAIFPLGVTINENAISTFLDIAVKNNLLTQADRDKITGYEIFRGDLSLNRSIVASGLLFDMRTYQEDSGHCKGDEILYPNYPFNSYSDDKFNLKCDNSPITSEGWGEYNSNFTFHSPETDYYRVNLPTELTVQGYLFGASKGYTDEVKDHPKWVILTPKAKTLASTLAILEVAAELTIQASMAASNAQVWAVGGAGSTGGSLGTPAFVAAGAIIAVGTAEAIVSKVGKYRYEWLKIFRDMGSPRNFAYYYFAEGEYNYIQTLQTEGDKVRGINTSKNLKDARYTTLNEVTGKRYIINNIDREYSSFISLGNHALNHPPIYKDFDKGSISSMTYSGENGLSNVGRSERIIKNIASPYVALKNYLPNQHSTVNSIKWVSTGFRGDFNTTGCLAIFGGDTFISRHTLKRKHPQFLTTSMGQADLTPFNYFFYNNIGTNPRFYVSYEEDKDFEAKGTIFPDIDSDYAFDNKTSSTNYFKPPSKFYLYYYGVPSFLTETRINTNYRYAKKEFKDNFFPQVGDLGRWTQESAVSIREPNSFFYNNAYSKKPSEVRYRILHDTFKQQVNDKSNQMPNGIIASLPDNNENVLFDPWLTYRPIDTFEFPSNYGKLKDIIDIEDQAILARFENTHILFNKVDSKVDDGQAPTSSIAKGNTFFQRRSTSFHNTKLGYGGTQNFASVSCEAGHFWVDAKRGQVAMVNPSGEAMEEISSTIGGKPSGMRNWFKEHLPFKILKTIPNADVDNPYNGVGITMGWDSRYKRILITKKDYICLNPCVTFDKELGYIINETACNSVPPVITCPEGYTYDVDSNTCKIVFSNENLCPEGFIFDSETNTCKSVSSSTDICPEGLTFNEETGLCEGEPEDCEDGLDLVFIVDATASQQNAIDNIRDGITTSIIPAIEAKFGTNYRLGLLSVWDRYPPPSTATLFDIDVPFAMTNGTDIQTALAAITVAGGGNNPEATDKALEAVLFNTPPLTRAEVVIGSTTVGTFRTNAAKAIVLVTDNTPAGFDDLYKYEDWLQVINNSNTALTKGIQIFPILTSGGTEPPITPPVLPSTPPSVSYLMRYYATQTGGTYSFNALGFGIDDSIVDAITGITCTETAPPICESPCVLVGATCVCTEEEEVNCEFPCVMVEGECICASETDPIVTDVKTQVSLKDPSLFKEVSWTIGFSLLTNSFVSYYGYLPNYYVGHNNYFQSGINHVGNSKHGLWSHLLTNKSFGVFYGEKQPFEIEYPVKAEYKTKKFNNVELWTEAKRYANAYDFTVSTELTFNKSIIYNNLACSGQLNLVPQKNNFVAIKDFPKTNPDNTQDIIISNKDNFKWSYDYIFNRVKSTTTNVPIMIQDINQIAKSPNSSIIKFKGINPLQKMEGDFFLNRLTFDKDSRYELTLKFIINETEI